jgi:hypothetical protein
MVAVLLLFQMPLLLPMVAAAAAVIQDGATVTFMSMKFLLVSLGFIRHLKGELLYMELVVSGKLEALLDQYLRNPLLLVLVLLRVWKNQMMMII